MACTNLTNPSMILKIRILIKNIYIYVYICLQYMNFKKKLYFREINSPVVEFHFPKRKRKKMYKSYKVFPVSVYTVNICS